MATKTWKIGEYCKGGIITVETKGDNVAVIAKEWDYSQGTTRSSNQSNAKEWDRLEVNVKQDANPHRKLSMYLYDLSTPYYSDVIMEWIQSKVDFNNSGW